MTEDRQAPDEPAARSARARGAAVAGLTGLVAWALIAGGLVLIGDASGRFEGQEGFTLLGGVLIGLYGLPVVTLLAALAGAFPDPGQHSAPTAVKRALGVVAVCVLIGLLLVLTG